MPVVVNGVKQLQKAMKEVEPELNKQMAKDIKTAMLTVRDTARLAQIGAIAVVLQQHST